MPPMPANRSMKRIGCIIVARRWLEVDGGLAAEVVAVYSEVTEGEVGHFSASGGAFDEAFLDEEGFVDLLDGAAVLAKGGGNGGETYGTATRKEQN